MFKRIIDNISELVLTSVKANQFGQMSASEKIANILGNDPTRKFDSVEETLQEVRYIKSSTEVLVSPSLVSAYLIREKGDKINMYDIVDGSGVFADDIENESAFLKDLTRKYYSRFKELQPLLVILPAHIPSSGVDVCLEALEIAKEEYREGNLTIERSSHMMAAAINNICLRYDPDNFKENNDPLHQTLSFLEKCRNAMHITENQFAKTSSEVIAAAFFKGSGKSISLGYLPIEKVFAQVANVKRKINPDKITLPSIFNNVVIAASIATKYLMLGSCSIHKTEESALEMCNGLRDEFLEMFNHFEKRDVIQSIKESSIFLTNIMDIFHTDWQGDFVKRQHETENFMSYVCGNTVCVRFKKSASFLTGEVAIWNKDTDTALLINEDDLPRIRQEFLRNEQDFEGFRAFISV